MELFRKILGLGKKEGKGQTGAIIELSLSDVEDRLNKRLESKKDTTIEDSTPLLEIISRQKKAATEIIKDLAETEFDEDIKNRTYRPILTSKPLYVKGMLDSLKGITERTPNSFEELSAFNDKVIKSLKQIKAVQTKQGKYMMLAFEKEMRQLGSSLNKIMDASEKIGEAITDMQDFNDKREDLLKKIEVIHGIKTSLNEEESEGERTKQELQKVEEEIKSLKQKIENLERSREMVAYKKKQEEVEALRERQKNSEKQVFSSVNPLLRALRKYERTLRSEDAGVEPLFLKKFSYYMESPVKAFFDEEPEDLFLEKILGGLKDAILDGKIRLDEREKSKTLKKIEELLKTDLKALLIENVDARGRERDLEEELSRLQAMDDRSSLSAKMEGLIKKKEGMKKSAKKTSKKSVDFDAVLIEIEGAMSEIEGQMVKIMNNTA